MILVDTHVLLWTLGSATRIGPGSRRVMERASVRFVSTITLAEVAIKVSRKKLRVPDGLPDLLPGLGFDTLALEPRHVAALNRFPQLDHHDPFDRMLVAQANVDRLTFVTADSTLLGLDQPWIIDATA